MIFVWRGNLLESILVSNGASERLPRSDQVSRASQWHHFIIAVIYFSTNAYSHSYSSIYDTSLIITLALLNTLFRFSNNRFFSSAIYCHLVIKSLDHEGRVETFFCLSWRAGAELLPHSDIWPRARLGILTYTDLLPDGKRASGVRGATIARRLSGKRLAQTDNILQTSRWDIVANIWCFFLLCPIRQTLIFVTRRKTLVVFYTYTLMWKKRYYFTATSERRRAGAEAVPNRKHFAKPAKPLRGRSDGTVT